MHTQAQKQIQNQATNTMSNTKANTHTTAAALLYIKHFQPPTDVTAAVALVEALLSWRHVEAPQLRQGLALPAF